MDPSGLFALTEVLYRRGIEDPSTDRLHMRNLMIEKDLSSETRLFLHLLDQGRLSNDAEVVAAGSVGTAVAVDTVMMLNDESIEVEEEALR